MNGRTALTPRLQAQRRRFDTIICWIYGVMGMISVGVGAYLWLGVNPALAHRADHPDTGTMGLSALCVVFGLWRLGLAFYNLRRLRASLKRADDASRAD